MLLSSGSGHAQAPCEPPAARVVSIQGTVELRRAGTDVWTPAMLEEALCIGDGLRVGQASRAALTLANDSTLRLDQRTTLQLRGIAEEERSLLELLFGAVYFFSHRPRALEVDTPFVNAAAEGTEFLVRVGADRAEVVMLDGRVLLQNPHGELRVASGNAALIPEGEAPRPTIVVRPRDAVAWALYYPPILTELAGRGARPRPLPPGLQGALERVADNDYAGALQVLETVPEAARDARYYTYLAGVLLNVGRVEAAEAAIERALALDPEAGEALAQRAIIHVVQNRKADALADARPAVELSPESSAARIALSYALQAAFQLEEARAVLREAVARNPEDALAWARLAELELMFGALGAARDAAERAVALAPGLARTQMVLGFAALTRIDIDQARAAFERAIALDSAEPLARLGLGLAKVRRSDLEEGRHEIEIAAALAPNDALIRSYLGKAYFEEKRDPLAGEQFAIAKELDPNDPTPWFYDAIRLQLDNRPVEALRSLERSIELNDNRAVYRSRLLLDEDVATRQTSLARIYDDLGFEQVARVEATKSLTVDPANHSAHRFLSDSLARRPRHQIARVSELLQSQLLQPININPVQPSLAVSDLSIVAATGPAEAAFNEFNPLFARNQAQLTASGLLGNNDTVGDEIVASAIRNRLSVALGQLYFDTDGFRENNDVTNSVYDVFTQFAITPALNLQAEYRHRDTDRGDLRFQFDPDFAEPTRREDVIQDTLRVGARLSPTPDSDIITSVFLTDRDSNLSTATPVIDFESQTDESGIQAEAQYIRRSDLFNLVAGGSYYNIDVDDHNTAIFQIPGFEDEDETRKFRREEKSSYAYGTIAWPRDIDWTLGVSVISLEQLELDKEEINPKFGVQWQATEWLRARAGIFQNVKRPLVVDQTIEPTQVAGFNQFFDDFNGTESTNYGGAIDLQLTKDLYAGVEAIRRDLEVQLDPGIPDQEDGQEDLYRLYLYWTPHPYWAFTAEYEFDKFKRKSEGELDRPTKVETISLPLTARLFHPDGFFAELGTTFVHQEVERRAATLLPDTTQGDEVFVLLDAAVGVRLPGRRGVFGIELRNLLDESFSYQDQNFRRSEIIASPLIPERTALVRFTVNF